MLPAAMSSTAGMGAEYGSSFLEAAQAMGQAALAGMQHVAGVPGAADAVAAMLQRGQAAALTAAQIKLQKKAIEDAKERNQQLKEKRQDDLVNAAADGDDEDDEKNIYQSYKPAKVNEGVPHPDEIVESALLAHVSPPDITYKHHLQDIVDDGLISSAQLEAVLYANMCFKVFLEGPEPRMRKGFFLGDGAGVGKGRTIAACIKEHFAAGHGTRALWVSVSKDLNFDAQRDLDDVRTDTRVFPEGNSSLPQGSLDTHFGEGVLFVTYSLLISGSVKGGSGTVKVEGAAPDVMLKKGTRLHQIVQWLSNGDGDPLIVFDEAHKAKNLINPRGDATQTGKTVEQLQLVLPRAKVIYSSATGASEPMNLAYMLRLGTFGFRDMRDLIGALDRSGLGALELFSVGLKATGTYISRSLSYTGAEFAIIRVEVDPVFKVMYNRAAQFWHALYNIFSQYKLIKGRKWMHFFGTQQRFFRQMLMAAKVRKTAEAALEAIDGGMCVVIGLQSTGEANTSVSREEHGDTLDDFVSAPKKIMQQFLEKSFPMETELDNRSMDLLTYQVHQMVLQYMDKCSLSAEAQAMLDLKEANKAEMVTPATAEPSPKAGPSSRRIRSPAQPQAAQNAHSAAAAAAAADSDDDDILMEREVDLDAVLERRRQDAICNGQMIDLAADMDDQQLQSGVQAFEEAEKRIIEQKKEKETGANLQRLQDEKDEAVAELEGAKQAVEAAKAAVAAAAAKTEEQPSEAGPNGDSRPMKGRSRLCKRPSIKDEVDDVATSPGPEPKRQKMPMPLLICDSEDESPPPEKHAASASPARSPPKAADGTAADDDVVCNACGSGDQGESILLCDGCEAGWHMECLEPQLEEVPDGDWYCPTCVTDGKAAGKRRKENSKVKQKTPPPPKPLTRNRALAAMLSDDEASDFVDGAVIVKVTDQSDRSTATAAEAAPEAPQQKASNDKLVDLTVSDGESDREAPVFKKVKLVQQQIFGRSKGSLMYTDDSAEGRRAQRQLLQAQSRMKEAQQTVDAVEKSMKRLREGTPLKAARRAGSRTTRSGRASESTSPISLSDSSAPEDSDFVAGDSEESDEEADSPEPVRRPYQTAVKNRTLQPDVEIMEEECNDLQYNKDEQSGMRRHPRLQQILAVLLRLWDAFELPPNPLDHLTELLGGPDKVAEMTGRKGMMARTKHGVQWIERRSEEAKKDINMAEKNSFMKGEKLVAIISEAASTGISLQADKRVPNRRRRCHLTLELPWSADKAIQQFGRSHRSNQASAPIYSIIVTQCGGEYRFAASAAKRLQSLGALLRGDRRALGAGQDLKEFDVDNRYGLLALTRILEDCTGKTLHMESVELPQLPAKLRLNPAVPQTDEEFYLYMKEVLRPVGVIVQAKRGEEIPSTAMKSVTSFLNRVLAMSMEDQEIIFKYFSDTMEAMIAEARSEGRHERGPINLQATAVHVANRTEIHVEAGTRATTYRTVLDVDRGLSWADAVGMRDAHVAEVTEDGGTVDPLVGFHLFTTQKEIGKTGYTYVILVTRTRRNHIYRYRIMRPNNIFQPLVTAHFVRSNYKKITDATAQKTWKFWYNFTQTHCIHGTGCKNRKEGRDCRIGMRLQRTQLITGAVLPIFSVLADVVLYRGAKSSNTEKDALKVVRTKITGTDEPLVGLAVTVEDADNLCQLLGHAD